MFDISWGELAVVAAVGAAVTGRRDLPAACRTVGKQLGRVVGLLQGARARADQFAANNELRQLQNELRSGLRELDQVRTELAVAASSQGMVGRTLGATTASANRIPNTSTQTTVPATSGMSSSSMPAASNVSKMGSMSSSNEILASVAAAAPINPPAATPLHNLAAHSETAVLEEEWEKRGIGFQTQAEQIQKSKSALSGNPSGSEILESLIKQSLTWDQYDKVVGEQDQDLQNRIATMKEKRKDKDS